MMDDADAYFTRCRDAYFATLMLTLYALLLSMMPMTLYAMRCDDDERDAFTLILMMRC
jgi:hypothetical protein